MQEKPLSPHPHQHLTHFALPKIHFRCFSADWLQRRRRRLADDRSEAGKLTTEAEMDRMANEGGNPKGG